MQQKAKSLTNTKELGTPTMPSLSDSQSAYLIDETQTRLNANMKKMSDLEPTLKDYYDAYIALKKEYDEYVDRIEADKHMLGVYSKMKNGIPMSSSLRVLRSESHNEMKPREKRKHSDLPAMPKIPWTDHAVDILTIKRKFIMPKELFVMVVEKFNLHELYKQHGRRLEIGATRWSVINACWFANCKASVAGRKSGKIVHVEGRIGLLDWVTADMKLRPEFVVAQ